MTKRPLSSLDLDARLRLAMAGLKDFNPNEPRNPHTGEWIGVGSPTHILDRNGSKVEVGDIVRVHGSGDQQDLSTSYHGEEGAVAAIEVAYPGAPIEHVVARVNYPGGQSHVWTSEELIRVRKG